MLNVTHHLALIYFVFHSLHFQNSTPRSHRAKRSTVTFPCKRVINYIFAVTLNVGFHICMKSGGCAPHICAAGGAFVCRTSGYKKKKIIRLPHHPFSFKLPELKETESNTLAQQWKQKLESPWSVGGGGGGDNLIRESWPAGIKWRCEMWFMWLNSPLYKNTSRGGEGNGWTKTFFLLASILYGEFIFISIMSQ